MATKKKKKRPAPRKRAPRRRAPRRQPESLRLRSVYPTLTCSDLQRSITFYCDVLGFTAGERWERDGRLLGLELKAGGVLLGLSQDDFARGRDRRKGEGSRLYLYTTQDVDAIAARAKSRGWTLTREPQANPWGEYTFSLDDPDGFHLTIARTEG